MPDPKIRKLIEKQKAKKLLKYLDKSQGTDTAGLAEAGREIAAGLAEAGPSPTLFWEGILTSPDDPSRRSFRLMTALALGLGLLGKSAAVPLLIGILRDQAGFDSSLRSPVAKTAIEALRRIGLPAAEALGSALSRAPGLVSLLGPLGDARAVGPICRTGAVFSAFREPAMKALAEVAARHGEGAREALAGVLRSGEYWEAAMAARAISSLDPDHALSILAEAWQSVGASGAFFKELGPALAAIGPAAVPFLTEALKDKRNGAKDAAALALSSMGEAPVDPESRLMLLVGARRWSDLREMLARQGAEGRCSLLAVYREETEAGTKRELSSILLELGAGLYRDEEKAELYFDQENWPALRALGRTAVPFFARLLEGKDEARAALAIEALGWIGSEQAVPSLIKYMGDHIYNCAPEINEAPQGALVRIGEPAAPLLREYLHSAQLDHHLMPYLLRALGEMAGNAGLATLIEFAGHESQEVREAAWEGLVRRAEPEATPGLISSLVEALGFWTRVPIHEALLKIGRPAVPLVAQRLVRILRKGDSSRESKAVGEALSVLADIKDQGAEAAVIDVLLDPSVHREVRADAVRTLGETGGGPAVEVLRDKVLPRYGDYDWSLAAREAPAALAKLGWRPADGAEEALACLAGEDWEALAKLGSTAIPFLVKRLEQPGPSARRAAETLEKIGWTPRAERETIFFLTAMERYEELWMKGPGFVPSLRMLIGDRAFGLETKTKIFDSLAGLESGTVGRVIESGGLPPELIGILKGREAADLEGLIEQARKALTFEKICVYSFFSRDSEESVERCGGTYKGDSRHYDKQGARLSGPWMPESPKGEKSVYLLENGDFGFLTGMKPAVYNASAWEGRVATKTVRELSGEERKGLVLDLALKLIEGYFLSRHGNVAGSQPPE